jgi:hypothetical protein
LKRLAVLMSLMGLVVTNAALADEPSLCKSMCASEKRECRASARDSAKDELSPLAEMPEKNPLARTAQGQVRRTESLALEDAGVTHRRIARAGACDDSYLRCTRACAPARR